MKKYQQGKHTVGYQPCSMADLNRAVSVLNDGGVVAFPTETYYGLAVDPLNPMDTVGARAPYWLAALVVLGAIVGQVLLRQAKPARGLAPQAGD